VGTIDGYILIQTQDARDGSTVADHVEQLPGVIRAERVHGAYDVIAEVHEGGEQDRSTSTVTAIRQLEGVLRALPLRTRSGMAVGASPNPEAA